MLLLRLWFSGLFELPPLEKTRNRRREQEHPTSLSDHASKVATLPNFVLERSAADSQFFGCFSPVRCDVYECLANQFRLYLSQGHSRSDSMTDEQTHCTSMIRLDERNRRRIERILA